MLVDYVAFAERHGIVYRPTDPHDISVHDLERAAEEQGVAFHQGDILIVRSGLIKWQLEQANSRQLKEWAEDKNKACVGISAMPEMIEWLWNRHFAAVAGDALAWESVPYPADRRCKSFVVPALAPTIPNSGSTSPAPYSHVWNAYWRAVGFGRAGVDLRSSEEVFIPSDKRAIACSRRCCLSSQRHCHIIVPTEYSRTPKQLLQGRASSQSLAINDWDVAGPLHMELDHRKERKDKIHMMRSYKRTK